MYHHLDVTAVRVTVPLFQNDDEADKDCDSLCDLVQIKPQENETTVKLPRNCQNTEEDVNDTIRT